MPEVRDPVDEAAWLSLAPLAARSVALSLPLSTRFRLRDDITPVQFAFLQQHGFLVFDGVASEPEVQRALAELDAVEQHLLAEGIDKVHGVPVWFGEGPDGQPVVELEAAITDQVSHARRVGARVRAKIYCGRRSAGASWFSDVVRAFQKHVLFHFQRTES